eukprot:CAMPEP_0170939504 /NCGR_PEP_ID=MMETSP0735-20130129/21992_1 /TAXON_ID=186038 /ORGANISM="Fragilariopsis kerguelensis, Strain L26-C5" /LENGTH=300 /DNA_ID=CAMNT_0011344935 /DNA_START=69 /DNA_END=971 /DNA_ORIENTATION=-
MPPQTRAQQKKSRSSNSSSSSQNGSCSDDKEATTTTTTKIQHQQERDTTVTVDCNDNRNGTNHNNNNEDDAMPLILLRPEAHRSTAAVGMCDIYEIGLENFIRRIALVRNLSLDESPGARVVFNLNDRAIIHSWHEVFDIERTYSTCLAIKERIYTCHGYIWKPEPENVGYFVLEEYNRRTYTWLPNFHYSVVVMVYYDNPASRTITKVDVQYDQLSFFLHVLGLQHLWRWYISNIMTPVAMLWMKLYRRTGFVNPVTFVLQLIIFSVVGYHLMMKLLLNYLMWSSSSSSLPTEEQSTEL